MYKFLTFFLFLIFNSVQAQTIAFDEELLYSEIYGINTLREAYAADLDNDGDLDILIATDNEIGWIENLEAGKYGIKQTISNEVDDAKAVYAEDLDGDGDMDVLSGSYDDDKVAWYENLGDGNFGDQIVISTSLWSLNDVIAADLNGDGNVDVLAASQTGDKIAWFRNLGGGTFTSPILISSYADSPNNLSVADFDGDGDSDVLAISFSGGEVMWFENFGASISTVPNIITDSMTYTYGAYAGDFDNDGDLDISVSGHYNSGWYENGGDGIFGTLNPFPEPGFLRKMYGADLDADGDLDLVIGTGASTVLFENLGDGDFLEGIEITDYEPKSVVLNDLNEDGKVDLLSGFWSDVVWHENTGSLTFGDRNYVTSTVPEAEWAHVVDFDLDGDLDVFSTSGNTVAYHENFDPGTFARIQVIDDYLPSSRCVSTADLDGDGDLDIIGVSHITNNVEWYENLGDGIIAESIIISGTAWGADQIFPTDLDLDGDMDLVIRRFGVGSSPVVWFENTGDGTFEPSEEIFSMYPQVEMVVEDVTADGFPDIVFISGSKTGWYENLGDGNFGSQILLATGGGGHNSVAVDDLDGDGDLDIIEASSGILYYSNNGDGSFDTDPISISLIGAYSLETTDINNDGLVDVVYVSASSVYWLPSTGGGTFDEAKLLTIEIPGAKPIIGADIDNDGDIDIVAASNYDDKVAWYENKLYDRNQLSGIVYFDADSSGTMDPSEIGIELIQVSTDPENVYSFTNADGEFLATLNASSGDSYDLMVNLPGSWFVTSEPEVYDVLIDEEFTSIDGLDFGIYPSDTITNAISCNLIGGTPMCGEVVNYWISYRNYGTTFPDGTIVLELHDSLSYFACDVAPDSIVDQTIYWSYNDLYYFHEDSIRVEVQMPETMDENLLSYLTVNTIESDETVYSITDSLVQTIICAHAANDKVVTPKGLDSLGYIPPITEFLDYIIRFQNTGTDTVVNLTIKDQLDSDLDWSTITPLSSSHDMTVDVNYMGLLEIHFPAIYLPDSTTNFLESQGYVNFRINLDEDLPLGTKILNKAKIHFDASPAVTTNTTINTIDCIDSLFIALEDLDSIVCDHIDSIVLIPSLPGGVFSGLGISGSAFYPSEAGEGEHTIVYTLDEADGCMYESSITISVISCLSLPEEDAHKIRVYPNPFRDFTTVDFGEVLTEGCQIIIHNALGQEVYRNENLNKPSLILTKEELGTGIYVLSVITPHQTVFTTKLIVQ